MGNIKLIKSQILKLWKIQGPTTYLSNKLQQKNPEITKTLENIHYCEQMKTLTHFSDLAK